MSLDIVDTLEAAEDELHRLRSVLDNIHAVMAIPFQWSSSTPEAVSRILEREGYTYPDEDDPLVAGEDDPEGVDLTPWQPPRWTRPDEEDDDDDA